MKSLKIAIFTFVLIGLSTLGLRSIPQPSLPLAVVDGGTGSGLKLGDVVTTTPITGGVNDIFPGADADTLTLGITMLGDLAVTAPVTGAASDVFPGANGAKATIGVATALTSAEGVSELATGAETITGTATDRVVTPAGLVARLTDIGTTITDDFPDIDAAETVALDITGLPGDDVQSTLIRIYLADGVNDPGADINVNFRLEFFTKDTKLGQDRIGKPIYFNLTYTEVKTGTWSAAGTGGDLDSSAGLLVYDWIRLMGGTAESVNLVTITDADTVVVTTLVNGHAVDEGICREVRIVDSFPFSDADETGEIHAKLTSLADPGDAIGITIAVTVK